MTTKEYDFGGYATKNNLKCSDGRVIRKNAFKDNDGQVVPLVWNHDHNDPFNVLGHAELENRDDGVYAYITLNDTEAGQQARHLIQNGDVNQLSIYANKLKQNGSDVMHGSIKEVSLVLAGANPGAYIDSMIAHGEESDEECIIYTGEKITDINIISHADNDNNEDNKEEPKMAANEGNDKTIGEVFDTLTDEQKDAVYALIGIAMENAGMINDNEEGDNSMKHNVFESHDDNNENVLSHSDISEIIKDGKKYGSLKESVLAHSEDYGIENIEYLFPDAQNITDTPTFIKRNDSWVQKVMNETHHTPLSRIKSIFADITEDEARAKGYIKGKLKKDEVFSLLKRTTTPTTIYKKQKIDRDDVIDITDFDVVAWLKSEMRGMLDEEIARAVLVGDGRLASSDDKINEMNIRPIWKDEDLYTIKYAIDATTKSTEHDRAKAFIRGAIKARKAYKGSGVPSLYTTDDVITECLLLEDVNGRVIYDSMDKLATALRVKEIVTVPVMENLSRTDDGGHKFNLLGLVVNLADYSLGADKGGAVNMFDDFDIDYNQQKYLIETRCSGALTVPYSAISLELPVAADESAAG